MEKIRWAPRLSQSKLWQLYQSDAEGLLDEDLAAQVGYALLDRCKSVVLVSDGQVECPRCGSVFQVRGVKPAPGPFTCPTEGCGWQITAEAYGLSYRHRDLVGNAGMVAFKAYIEAFPQAKSAQARMLLIDRLIHAFHWGLKAESPHRPVANNLIEGSLKDVVAFLDRLSFGEETEPQKHWREQVEQMWRKRRGISKGE